MKVPFSPSVVLALLILIAGSNHALAQDCSNAVSITSINGVLYKPDNVHGGRGPTILFQNPYERPGKRKIEIRDILCRTISSFGLYSTDWPYGARYYEKSGGGKHTAPQLFKLAKTAGSTNILVEGKQGKWIIIQNPLQREGEVYSPF